MTRGGAGIETATDTYRSTRSRKSSTVSSASGRELKDLSIDRIYASIADQQRELTYYRKKPAWVLMSPRTGYELQSETRDWVYLGTPDPPGSMPMIMIMGIPLRTEAWMPDGIVVVTDTYEDVPSVRWSGMSYDWSDIFPKGDRLPSTLIRPRHRRQPPSIPRQPWISPGGPTAPSSLTRRPFQEQSLNRSHGLRSSRNLRNQILNPSTERPSRARAFLIRETQSENDAHPGISSGWVSDPDRINIGHETWPSNVHRHSSKEDGQV
jgi:hypothetical protein